MASLEKTRTDPDRPQNLPSRTPSVVTVDLLRGRGADGLRLRRHAPEGVAGVRGRVQRRGGRDDGKVGDFAEAVEGAPVGDAPTCTDG